MSPEALLEAWASSVSMAFTLAKGERLGELHGRRLKTFDDRGLHPYSVEWGRILAYESMMPELQNARYTGEAVLSMVQMRREAGFEAAVEFAEYVRAGGSI